MMTLVLTADELNTITDMTWEEAGETSISSTTKRDEKITKALIQFATDSGRALTAWDLTDNDYETAQEAVAWLTVHLIQVPRLPRSVEGHIVTPALNEYKRLLQLIKAGYSTYKKKIFTAKVTTAETGDISSSATTNIRNLINNRT